MLGSSAGMCRAVVSALLLLVVSGCSGSASPQSPAALSQDAVSASGSTVKPTGNTASDYCALFTTEQIGVALGRSVKPGYVDPAKATAGCQWDAADSKGSVLIQALPAGMWYDLSGGTGQRSVQGIGEKAYIGPSPLGGVQAGAVAGDTFYLVRLNPAPAADATTGLLRTFISRSGH
jgi:hypothetical protein